MKQYCRCDVEESVKKKSVVSGIRWAGQVVRVEAWPRPLELGNER